ncbi:Ger(x)C family spore germination protein [Natronincola ferrireducens]|uniref:Germination protein, Ger(X)C family n=1 Tax=Natronincola ferrireducens TaxID=393762 RepID=A0A1G8Z4Q0_9FIRM|nr:Ger(x)C family spore germination protein [Natronincola ferrireducens]SDK09937.1 germination protein, Ger(x)C family [Natronincola ferrireducens]
MKKTCKILSLILICLLLSSCWDVRQLDDLYLVYGIGVDISQENPSKYLITVAAPTIHSDAKSPKIEISGEGTSLRNAQDNIQNKASRRITYANTKVFFISEEVARQGVIRHIDSLLRDPEGKGTIRLLVVEDKVVDLMTIQPPTSPLVTLYVNDLLRESHYMSTIPLTTMRRFNNAFKTDGIEPVIPFIRYGSKPDEFLINSIALFKGNKMIGKLEEIEGFSFMVLTGEVQGGFMTLPYPSEDTNENPELALRILRGKSNIKTEIKDSQLHIHHQISLVTHLSEFTSPEPVYDKKVIEDMQKAANLHLEAICEELIVKLQNQYESDNIGYGRYVRVNHPEYFDADNWNKQFSQAIINIEADVGIQMVGTVQ